MARFMGLEKQNDEIVAVIGFPDGRMHSIIPSPNNKYIPGPDNRLIPHPDNTYTYETRRMPYYEERYNRKQLEERGVNFDALKTLPYSEQGHPIQLGGQKAPSMPAPSLALTLKPGR